MPCGGGLYEGFIRQLALFWDGRRFAGSKGCMQRWREKLCPAVTDSMTVAQVWLLLSSGSQFR